LDYKIEDMKPPFFLGGGRRRKKKLSACRGEGSAAGPLLALRC
jgi:hypothetical protein